jgi:hypothetical protein
MLIRDSNAERMHDINGSIKVIKLIDQSKALMFDTKSDINNGVNDVLLLIIFYS